MAQINTGRWKEGELDKVINRAAAIIEPGRRVAFLSEQFLGIPYEASTLVGDQHQTEELVINLGALDCFTFLDYVEALRRAGSFSQFQAVLKEVRYRDGVISFAARNHFFSDWIDHNSGYVEDVTEQVGLGRARWVQKMLNLKEDGSSFVSGISPVSRTITYVPAEALDEGVMQNLRTGDYAGIYAEIQGLDVSHVGIIIRDKNVLILRHATSLRKAKRVIDQDFRRYMAGKAGLIVLRPFQPS